MFIDILAETSACLLFQVSFSRNTDEQGARGKLKEEKEFFMT